MKYLFLTGGLGLLLLLGLMYHYGFSDVAEAVAATGWGLLILIGIRALQIVGVGIAWSFLFPRHPHLPSFTAIRLRLVREGVNTLLPVAQVGGEFIGARLLAHAGLGAGPATATVIVDLFVQAMTQALFTMTGLGVLILLDGDSMLVREISVGLLFLVPGLIGFFLVQRLGGFGWIERKLISLAETRNWQSLGKLSDLDAQIQKIYRNRKALAANGVLHLSIWFFGSLEIWTVLTFMGHSVSFAEALVIESLMQAVRSASFAVPAGLGVQEGGLIALCAVFGLPATIALALSLSKRVAEIAVGSCGLVLWQLAESRLALDRSGHLQSDHMQRDHMQRDHMQRDQMQPKHMQAEGR